MKAEEQEKEEEQEGDSVIIYMRVKYRSLRKDVNHGS